MNTGDDELRAPRAARRGARRAPGRARASVDDLRLGLFALLRELGALERRLLHRLHARRLEGGEGDDDLAIALEALRHGGELPAANTLSFTTPKAG